jgi:hypothetical protein
LTRNTGKTKSSLSCGTGRKNSSRSNNTKCGSLTQKFSDSKKSGAAFKGETKEEERAAKRRTAALASFEAAYNNYNKTR